MEEEKRYTITCNEEQLYLIANAIEDWTRFLCGQCEMFNATIALENGLELRNKLHDEIHPLVTPELPLNASYGWSGGDCKNEYQRKYIAMGYGIYRQIRHFISISKGHNDVYTSPTLTCKEQGPLIKIEKAK